MKTPSKGGEGKTAEYPQSNSLKEELKSIFLEKAFLRRAPTEKPFRLASGGESWVFFDCKPVIQDPKGIALIAEIVLGMVAPYHPEAIGGIETGAIPISTAVAQLSYLKKNSISAFWVRRQRKTHGTEKWIEGDLRPGSRIVVVEDVTTKGNSVYSAIKRVEEPEMHCKVLQVLSLVDREEGARKKLEDAGYEFTSIFTISDFDTSM